MATATHGAPEDNKLALFIDMDNVVIGVRDARFDKFDIELVLARLVEKGDLIVKKAYADWSNHTTYKRPLHEAAIELIDIPESRRTGKNSADIKMVVDAMELSYAKPHIDTFVLVSGDSDFSPLVSKLRENGKHIIGLGVKNSSARLLIDNCDEFVFYDDLVRSKPRRRSVAAGAGVTQEKQEAFALLMETLAALQRENKDVLWGSLVKDTMKRKQPQFNEEYHGYSSFGKLLEDAEKHKLIRLRKDSRSGTYVIDEVLESA
ncbi:MAG: NYN domain-containing protein [Planctomycetota bacterium]